VLRALHRVHLTVLVVSPTWKTRCKCVCGQETAESPGAVGQPSGLKLTRWHRVPLETLRRCSSRHLIRNSSWPRSSTSSHTLPNPSVLLSHSGYLSWNAIGDGHIYDDKFRGLIADGDDQYPRSSLFGQLRHLYPTVEQAKPDGTLLTRQTFPSKGALQHHVRHSISRKRPSPLTDFADECRLTG
jgi:hypothetical protein